MRGDLPKKMDPELARKRWRERFTWKEGDIKIIKIIKSSESSAKSAVKKKTDHEHEHEHEQE